VKNVKNNVVPRMTLVTGLKKSHHPTSPSSSVPLTSRSFPTS